MGPVNRPLDLEWLEDFLALTEFGNFSRAAQSRAIAQPAFSRHIKALEEWAGVELIDRARHPAAATPAGEVFLTAAREVLTRLATARTRAHEVHEQAGRSLQFAATHVLSLAFFPAWLQGIEQQLQLGPIHMVSDSFRACEDLMLTHRVQFLLCYGHKAVATRLQEPEFTFAQVGQDLLVPVRAGGSAHIHLDLSKTPAQPLAILAYSQESGLGQIMRAELPQILDSSRFTPAITSHHAVLLKTMALEGRGLAWLPRSQVSAELTDGRLALAGGDNWSVPVDIRLFRGVEPLSVVAEAVWDQVRPRC